MVKTNSLLIASVLTAVTFCILNTAEAQTNFFNIGFEGGPGIRSLRGNSVIDNYHKAALGYSGGIFGQYNFNRLFSLKLAANYEVKGSKATFAPGTYNETGQSTGVTNTSELNAETKFSYLTFPLLFRAEFGQKVRFFVNFGPYAGLLLKETTTIDGNSEIPGSSSDETDKFKEVDGGITIGAGVLIPLKNNLELSFEARDNLGLSNISSVAVSGGGTIKTNSALLLIGLSFSIGQ
jgi:hypothetical protein